MDTVRLFPELIPNVASRLHDLTKTFRGKESDLLSRIDQIFAEERKKQKRK